MIDNKLNGDTSIYYVNKCFFSGEYKDNHKKWGFETFPNGDYYEGEFWDGKFHGEGYLVNSSIKYIYHGSMKTFLFKYRNVLMPTKLRLIMAKWFNIFIKKK